MYEFLIIVLLGVIAAALNRDIKKMTSPAPIQDKHVLTNVLANRLLPELNRLEIPGLQLDIIKEDSLYQLNLGTADYQRRIPLTNQHQLQLGQASKIYTATLIMKLAELEIIHLDETIESWFPSLKNGNKITIRHLLSQTSGIHDFSSHRLRKLSNLLNPGYKLSSSKLFRDISKGKPRFQPGTEHKSSQTDYLLLALIAEKATGKQYAELLEEYLLNPLNLQHTSIISAEQVSPFLISGYGRKIIPFIVPKYRGTYQARLSYGYDACLLSTTAGDAVMFLHQLFSCHVLTKESLTEMLRFYPCHHKTRDTQIGYGLGLNCYELENEKLWGFTDSSNGFSSSVFYSAEANYLFVLLANISPLRLERMLSIIIQAIHEEDLSQTNQKDQAKHLLDHAV